MGLFGEEFLSGTLVLKILVTGQFFNVCTGSVGFFLMMTNNEKTMRNNVLFSSILSVCLNITLIPLYGINGAAISTFSVLVFTNFYAAWKVREKFGFWTIPFIESSRG
jgi:O-antigen/teichoic acid export membrane protein